MHDLPAKNLETDRALFYPVLRNYQAGDVFAEKVVGTPVTEGLGVFACRKISRDGGRVGFDYLPYADLEAYGLSAQEVLGLCYENFFADDLEMDPREQDGSRLLHFTNRSHLASALLGYPTTYERFAGLLGHPALVLLVTASEILLTSAGSYFEPGLSTIAAQMKAELAEGAAVIPAVYTWTADKLCLAADKPLGSGR